VQPFDPAFAIEVVQEVLHAPAVREVESVMSNVNYGLRQAGPQAVGAATLPGQGGTYVFDETELSWKIDGDRAGAPADGVRFVWYVMDMNANTPAKPLLERGWVDVVLETEGDSDATMDISFLLLTGGVPTEVASYSIVFHEAPESGSFWLTAEGTVGGIEFDVERSFTFGETEGLYAALVSFGGEAGLVVASLEAPFDPTTQEATGDGRFIGSVLTDAHYLLIEADVGDVLGELDGTVEADDRDVLLIGGTAVAPTFQLVGGGSPQADVQTDMAEVWGALWGMLDDGVNLVDVLEGLYR